MVRLIFAASRVSGLSILGQLTVVAAIPLLTRLYSPSDFGVFMIYLGAVNILAATAALRLHVSLYVVAMGEEAHAALKLALIAIATTSLLTAGSGALLSASVPEWLLGLVYLVPIGMAATALVDVLNCWCLRRGHLHDFAIGKLVSPVFMTLSQLSFGVLRWGGESMVLAHILSQIVLIGFLSIRLFTWSEVGAAARVPWRNVIDMAEREYKFPLFDLPATVLGFSILNLPAILFGTFFGASVAGHFGVATRLLSSPISLVAGPLSNVFVAEAIESKGSDQSYRSGLFLVLLTGALITLPALVVGAMAPYFVVPLLGTDWAPTGKLIAAMALMGGAQALSTPVQEVSTLLRRQGLRLVVDTISAFLVFTPIVAGIYRELEPLHIIYAMSAGGAAGYLIKTVVSLFLLRANSRQKVLTVQRVNHHLGSIRIETGKVAGNLIRLSAATNEDLEG